MTTIIQELNYPKIVTYWADGFISVISPTEYRTLSQDEIRALVRAYAALDPDF
jgi:hypothetical protein